MKRSSVALTSLFYLTISTLGGELLMSFQKYNFPGLLMSILVLSMFILNYFNSKFIRLILVMISANVVLDTVWFFRYSGVVIILCRAIGLQEYTLSYLHTILDFLS